MSLCCFDFICLSWHLSKWLPKGCSESESGSVDCFEHKHGVFSFVTDIVHTQLISNSFLRKSWLFRKIDARETIEGKHERHLVMVVPGCAASRSSRSFAAEVIITLDEVVHCLGNLDGVIPIRRCNHCHMNIAGTPQSVRNGS